MSDRLVAEASFLHSGIFYSLVLPLYLIRTCFCVLSWLLPFVLNCTNDTTQTAIPPAGFELTIPAIEWPQTHALDHMATGYGNCELHQTCFKCYDFRVRSVSSPKSLDRAGPHQAPCPLFNVRCRLFPRFLATTDTKLTAQLIQYRR